MHPADGAQLGEQAAPPDGLELAGVTHEGDTPAVPVGEVDEVVEGGGADHAGLVDDERRADREPIPLKRGPVGSVPLVEEFGDGVGGDGGLSLQDPSRLGGGRDPEHGPAPAGEIVHGPFQGGGLAGTGRADHDDQPVGAGHRGGGVGLQLVQTGPGHGRLRAPGSSGLRFHRPRQYPSPPG